MVPKYTRQDLRRATKFVEGDYSGINPREFYRTLKRNLEEIQNPDGFKYRIEGNPNEDLEIQNESVGQKTGTVQGRMVANSEWVNIGRGKLEYRPYGPHGALGIALGVIFLFISMGSFELAVLGILTLGAGVYGYWQTQSEEFPIIQQDIIRVLIDGEVSERTVETQTESRTDIFANMSVVYASDSFVAVDTEALDDLHWCQRRELANQVKRWNNKIVKTEEEQYEVEDGLMWHLKGWAEKSVEKDRQTISSVQDRLLNATFEYRVAYTDLLENELGREMREIRLDHESNLMGELESLADDLNIYIEREGLQRTNQIGQQGTKNRRLEAGDEGK